LPASKHTPPRAASASYCQTSRSDSGDADNLQTTLMRDPRRGRIEIAEHVGPIRVHTTPDEIILEAQKGAPRVGRAARDWDQRSVSRKCRSGGRIHDTQKTGVVINLGAAFVSRLRRGVKLPEHFVNGVDYRLRLVQLDLMPVVLDHTMHAARGEVC